MENLKIAIAQMLVETNPYDAKVKERNMNKAVNMIEEAADKKADLVVLPEDFIGGYAYGPINMPPKQSEEILPLLIELARKHEICIAGTTLNRHGFINSYATAFFIDKNGEVRGCQNRIQRYESERKFVDAGKEIEVFETSIGKVGFLTGLDLLYPELARELKESNVEFIISPIQGFSRPAKYDDIEIDYPKNFFKAAGLARALENSCYVIMVNSVGTHPHSKQKLFGESMIVSPVGVIGKLDDSEKVHVICLNEVDKTLVADIPVGEIDCIHDRSFSITEEDGENDN